MSESNIITYSDTRDLPIKQVITLYRANGWTAADKPGLLMQALQHSHSVISAWSDNQLVGLGNAISDGYLVVYYPHLLVLPQYQHKGIGKTLMTQLQAKYEGFHMQILTADADSVEFYAKCGFVRAGATEPLWIYAGKEH